MEWAGAIQAAARGQFLQAFDVKDGHLRDGRRTTRAWLVHSLRVTKGQAGQYRAVQALAREHRPLLEGLRDGGVFTTSVALQLAQWTQPIPARVPGPGRTDPGRRSADRGRTAGAGGDVRGDPLAEIAS